MKWLKKHYDVALLVILAFLLLLSATVIIIQARDFPQRAAFTQIVPILAGTAPRSDKIAPIDTTQLENAMARLQNPATWQRHLNPNLFKAAIYMRKISPGVPEELILVDDDTIFHPPIPNKWILDRKLPLENRRLLDLDLDNDGFTVLEEFLAATEPLDPASSPPIWMKFRMKEFREIPFRFIFKARMGETVQVETLDLKQPSMFLRVGDKITGTDFIIRELNVAEQRHPELEMMIDSSKILIENPTTQESLVLPVGKVVNNPDSYVVLVNLVDSSQYKLQKDGDFTVKSTPNTKYKLIDMSPTKAVITNLETQEMHDIPPLKVDEMSPGRTNSLPSSGTQKNP